ncbi:Putative helicase, Zinc finger, RING-type, Zinc finger, RING/FYVE/PHD-type, HIRAN [Colletotrichum destructivum]|uniref:Helicase, Zinc finger, RING-type, Zinc finger, RING/FYVE/PHD-type, HIRAN n=1 Tax=Colletotrichum destructivum TaxID=34406 RepID=A0AAX4HV99_9PEZI|nr:Putative helicase, Zinc finger, RING-type, Zinc finger, RING/FYVE/PHD-type, HIRAN [Colletotrichum destructivum]
MEYPGSPEPPAKRRRFFTAEDDAVSHQSSPALPTPPAHPKQRFFRDADEESTQIKSEDVKPPSSPTRSRTPLADQAIEDASNRSAPPLDTQREESAMTFDQEAFESFVGDKVSSDVLDVIRDNCGDSLERAVNMYFDGTWKDFKKKSHSITSFARPSPTSTNLPTPDLSMEDPPKPVIRRTMPEARYIGSLGVEGWATRSGSNLLNHGDVVKIERQKVQAPQATRVKTKFGVTTVAPRGASAASRRVDVMVRFTNGSGFEIGRLAKETAEWVSTLIDQKICKFEGVCVYAPERLRTNDTVFIQLKCYLLASAFHRPGFAISDNRAAGFFEEKESSEEKELRLRQVALVKLLQEINLEPTRANATASKNQRQGLLQAAEMDDKKEKDSSRPGTKEPGSSPPSDEQEDGEELEQDQLDALYRKAQSFDFNTPEAEPAATFAMDLRPYQKQALHWMMTKEKDQKSNREPSMHPLWEEYAWPLKDTDEKELPQVQDQQHFYVNPYSGDLSLDFPVQEQNCLGGILADEMGLGKTIQMLSLVHSHRSDISQLAKASGGALTSVNELPRLASNSSSILSAPCTTLVVAPMSLLSQWQSEAEKASKEGTLKAIVYYGNDKANNLQALCCAASAASAPDVVITSYGVVLSEFNQVATKRVDKSAHTGIFSLNFFRVILDEAHHIKNRGSKTAKACYEISAEHRWVLTGTPIVNKLEDLFSLVRFLRVEPWNNFSFWKTFITVPFESKDFMRALDVVQTVLEPLVLRRTKDMKTPDGEPLVPLPPKHVEIVDVELSQTEREIYDYIFTRAKQSFRENVEAGTVMKAFTSIFAHILRLRQSCCHPVLVRNKELVADEVEAGAAADLAAGLADDMDLGSLIEHFTAAVSESESGTAAFGAHILGQIRDEAENECPICAEEPMIEQTVTGCWHSACKKCLLDYMKHQTDRHKVPTCPNCRAEINYRDLFEVVRHDDDPDMFQKSKISLQRLGINNSSAKVVALIKALRELRKEHPRVKSVIFSQFTSFLSLIEPALARVNIKFLRLDGSMAQKARAAVLDEFQESKTFTVLLLSLRAGGVGLNLTSAKRVYMMDPWWSFAVEAQAIDRVHRMGQDEEVKVYRFIVKESVEERMLRVQDRKKFIATSLGMMSDEEKKLQRIEDIKELLS